jgi:hypothetical protein
MENYFNGFSAKHIPRAQNNKADKLEKAVARKQPLPPDVFYEEITTLQYSKRKKKQINAIDGSRDLGSQAGPPLIDWSKAAPGTSTCPYRATTSSRLSQSTTLTNNSVGMTRAHILDCGNGWRLGPYQGADRGLQLGSALHVPASPTDRLVGRPGLGSTCRTRPSTPSTGITVPSTMAAECHYSICPSSRKDGAKCHHDTVGIPPSRWSDRVRCQGWGMIAIRTYRRPHNHRPMEHDAQG